MKISAIITAYKSQGYIERCLDSVCNQVDEVILGVDACQVTLQKIKEIKHKYNNLNVFMNIQNVGTYITRNTMYQFISNDWILQFDSDDELLPNTIETLKDYSKYQVIKFLGYNIKNGQRYGKVKHFTSPGIYHKSVFEKIGGYSAIRVAGDAEFKRKIRGNFKEVRTNVIGMVRYIYSTSLTQTAETGFRSKKRLETIAGFQKYYPNLTPIIPVTTQCYKI